MGFCNVGYLSAQRANCQSVASRHFSENVTTNENLFRAAWALRVQNQRLRIFISCTQQLTADIADPAGAVTKRGEETSKKTGWHLKKIGVKLHPDNGEACSQPIDLQRSKIRSKSPLMQPVLPVCG